MKRIVRTNNRIKYVVPIIGRREVRIWTRKEIQN